MCNVFFRRKWKCKDLLALHGSVLPAACSSPPQGLLSLSLSFYPPFRKRSKTHILSLSRLIFLIFLSLWLSLSTLMSFRCIRIGLRLQQPFSAGSILPRSLPPSLSRCLSSLSQCTCLSANTSALIIDSILALGELWGLPCDLKLST